MRNKLLGALMVLTLLGSTIGCTREWKTLFGTYKYVHIQYIVEQYVNFDHAFFEFDRTESTLYMAVSHSSENCPIIHNTYQDKYELEWDGANIIAPKCEDSECSHEECVEFRVLAQKNGDGKLDVWEPDDNQITSACAQNFTDITITSINDYDENHPAGTPLDDVVNVLFHSYKTMVEDGVFLGKLDKYGNGRRPDRISKKLEELTPHDMSIIVSRFSPNRYQFSIPSASSFTFTFESLPTLSQQHTLEIVFVSDEGEEFRFEVDVDFAPTVAEVEEK
ncbi:MAG: hypothetical protein IIV29_05235 [Tidjanibacter sp.]|nr:hypothetical protein [Tidjanibacter sp.]